MKYMQIRPTDIANGPGIRVTLFVSGCKLNCLGCFNKEAQNFNAGYNFNQDTIDKIIKYMDKPFIKGLTILGGDPLEPKNQKDTLNLIKQVRLKFKDSKDIWVWTGRKYEELIEGNNNLKNYSYVQNITNEFLKNIDILVDGPFIKNLNRKGLIYMGSINQKIIDVPKTLKNNNSIILSKYDYLENRE